jgi:hypothetical protein
MRQRSRAIQRGMIPGPTFQTAGRIIAPYGGQFHLQQDKQNLAEPEYFFRRHARRDGQSDPPECTLRRDGNKDRR